MRTHKLILIAKIIAIAILILGVVHDIATFTPLIQEGLTCLSPSDLNAMIYMSLVCGTSLILSGLLLLILLRKLTQFPFLNQSILIIAVFVCINGILSVIYMFDNPFAWLTLILGMAILAIILKLIIPCSQRTHQK